MVIATIYSASFGSLHKGRRGVEYSHENATLCATVGVGASALTRLDSLVNSGLAIGNRFAVRVRFRAGVLDLNRLAYQLLLWERGAGAR